VLGATPHEFNLVSSATLTRGHPTGVSAGQRSTWQLAGDSNERPGRTSDRAVSRSGNSAHAAPTSPLPTPQLRRSSVAPHAALVSSWKRPSTCWPPTYRHSRMPESAVTRKASSPDGHPHGSQPRRNLLQPEHGRLRPAHLSSGSQSGSQFHSKVGFSADSLRCRLSFRLSRPKECGKTPVVSAEVSLSGQIPRRQPVLLDNPRRARIN
jgi:hypothetical protein